MRILVKDIEKYALVNIVNVYSAAHVRVKQDFLIELVHVFSSNVFHFVVGRDKEDFLIELVHVFSSNVFPLVVGGDFNIIRKSSDCNKKKEVA
jgi:exonuclease III